jgi:hypothetical protein
MFGQISANDRIFGRIFGQRRATIRPRSGLGVTAGRNLYYSFQKKTGLLSCKTSGHGNLSEPSLKKNLGESSDTEAIHAHFCPNIGPIYHLLEEAKRIKRLPDSTQLLLFFR